MGDHRASIKIEMEFHGIKDSCDMWINYSPDGEYPEIDDRIISFIRSVYNRGMEKYDEETYEYREEQKKEERKKLYEVLKKEFGEDIA